MTEKMVKYSCSDCGKKFDQKSHYDSHKKRKIPCVIKDQSLNEFIETKVKEEVNKKMKDKELSDNESDISETSSIETEKSKKLVKSEKKDKKKKEEKKPIKKEKTKQYKKKDTFIDESYLRNPTNENVFIVELKKSDNKDKSYVLSKIKQAHQILYDAENIEGLDAMNDIMNFIFLRLIQDKITDKKEDGKIDLKNTDYYTKEITKKAINYLDLKKLADASIEELRNKSQSDLIKRLGSLLKEHPLTGQIFDEDNFIKAEKSTTIQLLLKNNILDIDIYRFSHLEDLIGDIYEFFINSYTKGNQSKLSQYFTPRKMMMLILKYQYKQIINKLKNAKNIKVADWCMGTGGWLVSFYNMFKDEYYDKILLSGADVKKNTFMFGLMNIINTTGKFPYQAHRDNSLTYITSEKYDFITTNPPFKTEQKIALLEKNFNNTKKEYNELNKKIQDKKDYVNTMDFKDVFKLYDNNPPIQFLELCIYKLNEGGKCIIVLPYGELFFGSSYKKARSYFLETIDITHIILCPSGVFTHTGIKSCVLIFNKNEEGTKEITFLKTNKECTELIEITSIKREDINKEPNISFYHRDYLNDEYITELIEKMPNFEWVEFGKVFTLEKGKLQSSKVEEDEKGDGIFINWSIYDKYKKINNSILDGENLFISTSMPNGSDGGYMVIKYYNGKCDYCDLMSKCNINDKYKNKINLKFIYYYLMSVKKHIETIYEKGSCNKSLDRKNFDRMKIPIPSIEVQDLLVKKMDSTNDKVFHMTKTLDIVKSDISNIFEWTLLGNIRRNQVEYIKFGELYTLEKGQLQSSKVEEDENGITFVTGANEWKKIIKQNTSYINGRNIFISTSGNGDKVPIKYYDGECNYSDLMSLCKLDTKYSNKINSKWIYYYLKSIKEHIEENYQKGSCNLSLDQKNFNRMKIPVIPKKEQDDLIKTINRFEEIIDYWNKHIDETKKETLSKFLYFLEKLH